MLLTCILGVLGSNLSFEFILTNLFCRTPQLYQANAEVISRLGNNRHRPHPFHHPKVILPSRPVILSYHNIKTKNHVC